MSLDDIASRVEEMGISSRRIRHWIAVYSLMVERKDTDPNKWSHYDVLLASNQVKKVEKQCPGFTATVLKEIKAGKVRAVDVRDKVSNIAKVGAIDLLYRHGFGAVGLDRILEVAGVTKTTFYKHFEGKDDLMVAAVLRRDEWESAAWSRMIHQRAGDDPVAQLLATLDVLDLWFNAPDFRGCMFLNAAVEFPNPHDPVHQAAAACKERARDQRRDLARAAGADAAAAETFADCFTTVLEGALVMRQMHGRNDAARVVRPGSGGSCVGSPRAGATSGAGGRSASRCG